MPVQSMTGFARSEAAAPAGFAWEIRSVNGKGLDLRFRLPPGFEMLEPELRRAAGGRLARGNIQAALQLTGGGSAGGYVINETMLRLVAEAARRLAAAGEATAPRADGLLALRGVIEPADAANGAGPARGAEEPELRSAVVAGFEEALEELVAGRTAEGAALVPHLAARLDEIEALVARAEAEPSRRPEAIRQQLASQVAELIGAQAGLDPARLHAEAALLATRADIREEIDRLRAHVAAARALLDKGGPVGRRLDFLAQEFNREANTICSKSNAAALTEIGLDLKTVIDQFREQVQNVE